MYPLLESQEKHIWALLHIDYIHTTPPWLLRIKPLGLIHLVLSINVIFHYQFYTCVSTPSFHSDSEVLMLVYGSPWSIWIFEEFLKEWNISLSCSLSSQSLVKSSKTTIYLFPLLNPHALIGEMIRADLRGPEPTPSGEEIKETFPRNRHFPFFPQHVLGGLGGDNYSSVIP